METQLLRRTTSAQQLSESVSYSLKTFTELNEFCNEFEWKPEKLGVLTECTPTPEDKDSLPVLWIVLIIVSVLVVILTLLIVVVIIIIRHKKTYETTTASIQTPSTKTSQSLAKKSHKIKGLSKL